MARYRFGDVVKEVKINVNRDNNPYEFYVAGDHMDSEDLIIRRKGRFLTDDVGPAFTRIFHPGQVLYGSRRTYLKKVAIADFDGICANTTFVLETKDNNIFTQELLPFIMLSDRFTEWSVSHSKGSTNPYVLFSDLADFEIELPDINTQRSLAKKLTSAHNVKESYKTLQKCTDEMVKSQFIEMFGEQSACNRDPLQGNVNEMFIGPFGSSLKNDCFVEKEDGYCVVYEQKHAIDKDITVPFRYVTERKYNELKRFTILPNDIIVSCRGTVGQVFMIPENAPMGIMHPSIMKIRLKVESYLPEFFVFALTNYMKNREIQNVGTGIKMAVTATTLAKEKFAKPSISEQQHFVDIVHQADKSKFELKKSIEAIDKVIKSLINNI